MTDKMLFSISFFTNILKYYGVYDEWERLYKLLNWSSYRFWFSNSKIFKGILKTDKQCNIAQINKRRSKLNHKYFSPAYIYDKLVWIDVDVTISESSPIFTEFVSFENVEAMRISLTQSDSYTGWLVDSKYEPQLYVWYNHAIKLSDLKSLEKIELFVNRNFLVTNYNFVESVIRAASDITLNFQGTYMMNTMQMVRSFSVINLSGYRWYPSQFNLVEMLLFHWDTISNLTIHGFILCKDFINGAPESYSHIIVENEICNTKTSTIKTINYGTKVCAPSDKNEDMNKGLEINLKLTLEFYLRMLNSCNILDKVKQLNFDEIRFKNYADEYLLWINVTHVQTGLFNQSEDDESH